MSNEASINQLRKDFRTKVRMLSIMYLFMFVLMIIAIIGMKDGFASDVDYFINAQTEMTEYEKDNFMYHFRNCLAENHLYSGGCYELSEMNTRYTLSYRLGSEPILEEFD